MKALVNRPYTRKEMKAIADEVDRRAICGISKAQWLMLLAFNETLGIGEQRFLQVMSAYSKLLDEYKGYQRDQVADELLSKRIRQILPHSFCKLYEEG